MYVCILCLGWPCMTSLASAFLLCSSLLLLFMLLWCVSMRLGVFLCWPLMCPLCYRCLCFFLFLFAVPLCCFLIPLVVVLLVAIAIAYLLRCFHGYTTYDMHSLSVASGDQWGWDMVWGWWVAEHPFASEVVRFLLLFTNSCLNHIYGTKN